MITEHDQSVHLQLQGRTLHAGNMMERLAGRVHCRTDHLVSIMYCCCKPWTSLSSLELTMNFRRARRLRRKGLKSDEEQDMLLVYIG